MFYLKVDTKQLEIFFLSFLVCSTTLWVGQLDKKTQQSDVMSLLEEFGQIESINVSLNIVLQKYFAASVNKVHLLLLFNLWSRWFRHVVVPTLSWFTDKMPTLPWKSSVEGHTKSIRNLLRYVLPNSYFFFSVIFLLCKIYRSELHNLYTESLSPTDCLGIKQRYKTSSQKVLGCGAGSHLHSLGQSQSWGVGELSRRGYAGSRDAKSR